jgi:hypothetical protein
VAQARNRPPRLVGPIIVAVLVLLAVLCARVDAAPGGEEAGDDPGDLGDAGWEPQVRAPACGRPYAAPEGVPPPPPCAGPTLSVGELVKAAYRAAGVADDPSPSWRKRSRLAGLVPWISVRGGRNATWRDVTDPTLGYTTVFDVSASWHLDRLAFDPNEIRIAAIDVSRRRERRRIAALVIHSYYLWRATGSDEVLAELDADTDGWFSQALAKAQKP